METFVNTDVQARTWTRISRPDGRTLSLAPGEEAELDPAAVDAADPYLKAAPRPPEVAPALASPLRPFVTEQTPGATTPEVPDGTEPDKE